MCFSICIIWMKAIESIFNLIIILLAAAKWEGSGGVDDERVAWGNATGHTKGIDTIR